MKRFKYIFGQMKVLPNGIMKFKGLTAHISKNELSKDDLDKLKNVYKKNGYYLKSVIEEEVPDLGL